MRRVCGERCLAARAWGASWLASSGRSKGSEVDGEKRGGAAMVVWSMV